MPHSRSSESTIEAPGTPSTALAQASERFLGEVHESLRKQAAIQDMPTASSNACPGEFEVVTEDHGGVGTSVLRETPYGDYLDQLKDQSLQEPIPDVAPELSRKGQLEIAQQALEATKRLLAAQPGSVEFRDAFRALGSVFSGNRMAANPELRADYFKEITDFLNVEMQKIDPNIKFGTSSISGAVVLGVRDGGGFRTVLELRNEITCPDNPYA